MEKKFKAESFGDVGRTTVTYITVANYLYELANHVTEDDAKDLPSFLRVLAERVRQGEMF